MKRSVLLFVLLLFLSLFHCQRAARPDYSAQKSMLADSAALVSPHPLATEIGIDVLRRGGNAVDAAVAVQFALAVVYPRAGNIGGGGFMVIRRQDGSTDALDYREKAPLAADRNMYLDSTGAVIEGLSRYGHRAVGVPGSVAGLIAAHKKYGSLPFSGLLEPAIELAEKGFRISETEAARLRRFQDDFKEYHETGPHPFIKKNWQAGDRLVQPNLAQTLRLIRDQGRAGFYAGITADRIVAEMERGDGLITREDLRRYQAKWRRPVEGDYKNYRIISMPPPSSGGIALIQLMEMVEPYPIAEWGFHHPKTIHLMAEAERRVYADRAQYLGDSDFYNVPRDSLMDSVYVNTRMASFNPEEATLSDSILAGKFQILESFETTHTSVVDPAGNAVSVTTTLNSNYGSKVYLSEAGFFLNNEMDDFSAKPGVPNQFGLIGAEANSIRPEKRMLSSMTPTIVEKDGHLFLVLGAPGGSTIITAVYQVMLNVIEFEMDLQAAVNAGRFHHQWLPDQILVEEGTIDSTVIEALQAKGHQVETVGSMARIKAVHLRSDRKLHAVGDFRNPDDDVAGY